MMRLVLSLVFSLLLMVGAQAQTGAVKTLPQLQTEIGSPTCTQPGCLFPDNATQLITPFDLRQGLLDMSATFYGMSGDCVMSGAYIITCTKTQGLPFAASSTTDTTNATNITSGSLALNRIAALATDQYLGTLGTVGPPTAINFVPCTGALTYALGTGFGCNTTAGTGTVTNATVAAGNGVVVTGTCAITTSGTCTVSAPLRGYIAGLTMSNDVTNANTTLDIAAGQATDSTNVALINVGAFTKTTGGSWAPGTGAAGLGNTVTLGASAWYHVCLARNGGTPDYFFDTVAACTNRPALITDTLVRRIGSFKTTSGSAIWKFIQNYDTFNIAPVVEVNSNVGAITLTLLGVPPGVVVTPLGSASCGAAATSASSCQISLSVAGQAWGITVVSVTAAPNIEAAQAWAGPGPLTNTNAQIAFTSGFSGGLVSISYSTIGWIDSRGKNN